MEYGKLVDGNIVYFNGYVLRYEDMTIIRPTQTQLRKAGYYPIENIREDGTDYVSYNILHHYLGAETLEEVKERVIESVKASVDSAKAFTYGEQTLWFNEEARASLMNTANVLSSSGVNTITLAEYGYDIEMSCEDLINMLKQLETYTQELYTKAQECIETIQNTKSLEEVNALNFTTDFTDTPSFNIPTNSVDDNTSTEIDIELEEEDNTIEIEPIDS